MTRRKLKGFVLPTIYVLAIGTIVVSILLIGRTIQNFKAMENGNSDYVINQGNGDDGSIPVINEEKKDEITKKIVKPFSSDKITVLKDYYDYKAAADKQQNALIYYEGTYMPNSGILYTSTEEFDILATADGVVSNIKEDEILGFIIEIEHNTNLTTVYQSIKDPKFAVGAQVKQGDIIAKSGTNKIDAKQQNSLLFEVFHKGTLINPNSFYGMEIESFSE